MFQCLKRRVEHLSDDMAGILSVVFVFQCLKRRVEHLSQPVRVQKREEKCFNASSGGWSI